MKSNLKKLFFLLTFLISIFGFYNFDHVYGINKNSIVKSTPILSIVMPVYNVAPYLDEALDSAENQTLEDIEIICVNDGSTDNSLEILENHAKKNNRIKIISQKNQGLSGARNTGMNAATGKYIYFFDSDDVMALYAMEKAVEKLEKYNADMLEFNVKRFEYNDTVDLSNFSYIDLPVKVCNWKKGENPFDTFNTKCVAVWTYVYRRSFLTKNNLEFKKGLRTHEDILFTWLVTPCLKKMVKDKNIGYFHRIHRPGSIINTDCKVNTKRLDGFIITIRELSLNRKRFKFRYSQEYLLRKMLWLSYDYVAEIQDKNQKSFYADKVYKEIWTNFAEKYRIIPDKNDKKQLNDLKKWSQDTQKNKKTREKSKKQLKNSRGKNNVTKRKNT